MSRKSKFKVGNDQPDYSRGSTVEITADNLNDGDTVEFSVIHVDGAGADGIYGTADDAFGMPLGGSEPWRVTDGSAADLDGQVNGVIATSWYVNPDAANQTFVLSATEVTTGEVATTTFTDSPTPSPADASVDLTASGNFGEVDGAVFSANQIQATGAGSFPAFLSMSRNGTEQGYNSDYRPVQFNEVSNANHNHSLLLANIPIVEGGTIPGTVEGLLYREFLLDANEGGSGDNPFLSLDGLQIFQETSGSLGGNFVSGLGFVTAPGNRLVYDLDANGDAWIALNGGLSSGSGQSDIQVLIPESFFDPNVPYVYLYS